jgi:hypothetical protein
MKTDERDAMDRRVKEMSEKREDPFFSPTIFSSIGYVFKLKLSYWFKIHQIRFFHIFNMFSYFSFLFNIILVVHFYLLAYLYHLLLEFLHYSFIFHA